MPFGGLQATNFGLQVVNKTQQGKKLHLTRVAIGDGVSGSSATSTFTSLLSEKMSFLISDVRARNNESVIVFKMSNEGLEEGFYYREIGVYARDPDTNEEGLYLYDNCRAEGEYIDDGSDLKRRVNVYMRLYIKFAQTDQIFFDPGGDPLYVLYEEFDELVQDYTARAAALEAGLTGLQASEAAQGVQLSAYQAAIEGLQMSDAAQNEQLSTHQTAIEGLQTAVEGVHTHGNKGVLDGITASKVTAWDGKADKAKTVTVTLTAAGWAGSGPYTQTVNVSGVTASDDFTFWAESGGEDAQIVDFSMISGAESGAGTVTFTAQFAKPTVDLNLKVRW